VDCRDNGTVEIAEGDPMVCTTTALHVARISTLSDVLTRVLLAQVDRQPVRLEARGPLTVSPVSPAPWRVDGVDVKRDQSLSFAGSVTCRQDQAGRRLPLDLRAVVGGTPVASARVEVSCGDRAATAAAGAESEPPSAAGPVAAPGNPGPQAAAPVAPPPPPVPAPLGGSAPAAGTAPGSATAPGTAPGQAQAPGQSGAPGGSAAVGAADRVEEEVALATAPLQMSSTTSPRDPALPLSPLLPAALLTAVTTGALLHRERRRTDPRPIRSRTR
jgi:hypothetical protein